MPQGLPNTLWAVATLKDAGHLAPTDVAVINAMCANFMAFVHSPITRRPATSQSVSNLLWVAATLDVGLTATVLNKLCAYLVYLVQQTSTNFGAQEVFNAWSFYKMRHSPEPAQVSALLAHFTSMFANKGKQPTS